MPKLQCEWAPNGRNPNSVHSHQPPPFQIHISPFVRLSHLAVSGETQKWISPPPPPGQNPSPDPRRRSPSSPPLSPGWTSAPRPSPRPGGSPNRRPRRRRYLRRRPLPSGVRAASLKPPPKLLWRCR